MENTKYNGWTNYETWNAMLWIDNDWRLSEQFAMIAADLTGSYEDADEMACLLADNIKDMFEEFQPELEPGFYSDVLNASMRVVNWYEIAKTYIDAEIEQQAIEKEEA
jgi:hypothetical protein